MAVQCNEAYLLSLPGKRLDISFLVNNIKEFHTKSGRDGALLAMQNLEKKGLGKIAVKSSIKVCTYTYIYYIICITVTVMCAFTYVHCTCNKCSCIILKTYEFIKTEVPGGEELVLIH